MTATSRVGTCLLICAGLTACGGGGEPDKLQPEDVDYSALKIAESREASLTYARNDEELLQPLRNGLRLMAASTPTTVFTGTVTPSASAQGSYSGTTVQVEGVDESDSVKYDGRYIYATRREILPNTSGTTAELSRNVLDISRTDPATAGVEPVSKYVIEDVQSSVPLIYRLQSPQGTTEYLAAVSQNFYGWLLPQISIAALVAQPDKTTIQLLDVRDPRDVSQTWKLQLDGWLRASRMIGDTLYLVSSYRPRIPRLILPADTQEKREANERLIRGSAAGELLPSYSENGGARRPLVTRDRCLIAQLASHEGYTDLVVISAIDVRTRRVTDVNCLSTNVNSVFMSKESLYVAGTGYPSANGAPITVLHKLAIGGGEITYRATGAVTGGISWGNPSYFMDEYNGDLRILTTANGVHRLHVLRESGDRRLMLVSRLPNDTRPAPIGKPNESVYAVRFMDERAYVVTFRVTDPLYVIDLKNPADPVIAGELEIPGFSTYLHPVGPTQSELLLSVGQEATATGRRAGIKVQLFDVRDIANPQLLGQEVFGAMGSSSEALNDPHALTFLELPGTTPRYRFALPILVADTADPTDPNRFNWTYSGLHMFEVADSATGTPQLHFQGVIKTEQPNDGAKSPVYYTATRGILHDDAVFAVHGERVLPSLWQDLPAP